MKKGIAFFLFILLLFLGGCRGGGLVFKGFHESQDQALLEKLAERYPKMEFTCTGQTQGAVHNVSASDGTDFPAWTAPGSKGNFQIISYYLEEWLTDQGFYSDLEEQVAALGFSWEYENYNHYSRHFNYTFGSLEDPQRLQQAVEAVDWTKERFDLLFQKFQEATGCEENLSFTFSGNFMAYGEEHLARFYIAPPGDNISWEREYSYDDYAEYLRQYLEDIQNEKDKRIANKE